MKLSVKPIRPVRGRLAPVPLVAWPLPPMFWSTAPSEKMSNTAIAKPTSPATAVDRYPAGPPPISSCSSFTLPPSDSMPRRYASAPTPRPVHALVSAPVVMPKSPPVEGSGTTTLSAPRSWYIAPKPTSNRPMRIASAAVDSRVPINPRS